jgi:hypothetical protein
VLAVAAVDAALVQLDAVDAVIAELVAFTVVDHGLGVGVSHGLL